MAERAFSIIQRRQHADAPDEIIPMGTGVDHGDGTATVTPAEGLPGGGQEATVRLADLTEGFHGGTTSTLVYDDER